MEGLQVVRGGERGGDKGGGDKGGGDTTRCGSGEETTMPPGLGTLPGFARATDTSLRIRERGPSFDRHDWRHTDRRTGTGQTKRQFKHSSTSYANSLSEASVSSRLA